MTSIGQKDTETAKTKVRPVESPQVLPLSLPHYVDQPGSAFSCPSYHGLGHFLRSNIFPGATLTWTSVTRDSYISHSHTAWPAGPGLWHGRKTDEMIQWTEKNIINQKLNKMLAEMEKKDTAK